MTPDRTTAARARGHSATRSANTERLLDTLRAEGPSSQAALARCTGLSPATVNAIVRTLRKDGRAEVRPVNGREALVALVSGASFVVAVEISHDVVQASAFDFRRGARHDAEQEGSTLAGAVTAVRQAVEASGSDLSSLTGVGVAIQAPVERSSGAVAAWVSDRLPAWRAVPLRAAFERELGVPVLVDNDVNLAALAEWTWGIGRGVDDFLYIHAGRGVGGGLVVNGEIYRGGSGMAGLLGHMELEPAGAVCYCGSRGCLTTLVSEVAIIDQLGAQHVQRTSLQDVIASARHGDPACQRILGEVGRHLGRALANATKVVAPSLVAIGGPLGAAGPLLFTPLVSTMAVRNLRLVAPATRIRPARLRHSPAMLGAVAALLISSGQGLSELPPWAQA